MKYIKKFNTSLDYISHASAQSTSNIKPLLGYAEDMDYVYFNNQEDNETSDKRFAQIGDWVLAKADGSKLFVGDKVYQEKYINSEEWTAIAKVVVPYNEFKDKSVRCVALEYTGNSLTWGSDNQMSSLYNCDYFITSIPGTTTITLQQSSSANECITAFQYPYTTNKKKSVDPHLAYSGGNDQSLYNITTHDKNNFMSVILNTGKCYYDGKYNTNEIKKLIPTNLLESPDIITDISIEGNYPAAISCLKYTTVGTQAGDWYLPSIYEVMYILENQKVLKSHPASDCYIWTSSICDNKVLIIYHNGGSGCYMSKAAIIQGSELYSINTRSCVAFLKL